MHIYWCSIYHAVHIYVVVLECVGVIPCHVYSLCNYQLDLISQENNNSLPQCLVEDRYHAAVREQSTISILLPM